METVDPADIERTRFLEPRDHEALGRFVARLEYLAWDEEDCEAAEQSLHAGLALMDTFSRATEPGGDPQALAKATLARPEFATTPPLEKPAEEKDAGEGWLSRWWSALWRAIQDWLKSDREHTPERTPASFDAMAGANLVMVVAVGALAAMLGYLLLRGLRREPPHDTALDESGAMSETALLDPSSALARPPESWAGLADELASRGSFREAIRHLYLALLARLHQRGAIDYDPTCSNWDYLWAFKGPPDARATFRDLTGRFDFAWYGHLDVTQEGWVAFRRVAEPLVAPPLSELAHG
jgi:hypothetical protein